MVAQLALSLGVACAGALLGGFTAETGNGAASNVLEAFQLTFVTVGIMAMLAAAIFLQLSPNDGRRVKGPEKHIEP
ncbi:putative transport protein HsrA [compost metagenome]